MYVKFSEGYGRVRLLIETGAKKLIAGVGMFFVVYSMNRLHINSLILVFLEVIVGAVVYGLLLLFLRDEWIYEMFKSVIGKMRKYNG